MKNKVVIIGSGFVGSSIAYALTFIEHVDEVVLIDIDEARADGEALDINSACSCIGTGLVRKGTYADCTDSQIIVITAGINRRLGQTRDDLLDTNKAILTDILSQVKEVYKNSFVIIATNPVDAMTKFIADVGFIPADKLCGTGCMLDTARWIAELAKYLNVDSRRIEAYAVGKHGSRQDLLWDRVNVDGLHISEFCKANDILWNEAVQQNIKETVTNMGADIIAKKGKTQFGIASVVAFLVNALLHKEKVLVSVGSVLELHQEEVVSRLCYLEDGKISLAE